MITEFSKKKIENDTIKENWIKVYTKMCSLNKSIIFDEDEIKMLLFEYCEINKCVPSAKTIYKNKLIGLWLYIQKEKINRIDNKEYLKLATNMYVKESLDEYLVTYKKNRILLFEFCDKYMKIPQCGIIYKGEKIAQWVEIQKSKMDSKNNNFYVDLSTNEIVKEYLDMYLYKINKWNNNKLLLFDCCNENRCIPNVKVIFKGEHIGLWLYKQKKMMKNNKDDIYIKLSENEHVKSNLDNYLKDREKKGKRLSLEESKNLLFEYCDKNKCIPDAIEIYKEKKIGTWFRGQRRKISNKEDQMYIKLSINEYVKKDLNIYIKNKIEIKKKEHGHERDKLMKLLFEYCDKNKCTPSSKVVYKEAWIGSWLYKHKNRINNKSDNLYVKMSANQYIKRFLDNYLEYKNGDIIAN
jgi:hypothetical protein